MLGILCGLQSEAKIADRIPGVLVGFSGARRDRAEALVEHMLDQGATRLVSFGIAGALSRELVAGDLLLGATVVSAHGAWEADEAWNRRLIHHLNCYHCAPLWGSDTLLATAKEKQACAARSGCLAADMESHIVAKAAMRARRPFNILRAVADTSAMSLPPAALVPMKADGKIDFRAIFDSIRHQPAQIPDLIRLGLYTGRALSSLRAAVATLREVELG